MAIQPDKIKQAASALGAPIKSYSKISPHSAGRQPRNNIGKEENISDPYKSTTDVNNTTDANKPSGVTSNTDNNKTTDVSLKTEVPINNKSTAQSNLRPEKDTPTPSKSSTDVNKTTDVNYTTDINNIPGAIKSPDVSLKSEVPISSKRTSHDKTKLTSVAKKTPGVNSSPNEKIKAEDFPNSPVLDTTHHHTVYNNTSDYKQTPDVKITPDVYFLRTPIQHPVLKIIEKLILEDFGLREQRIIHIILRSSGEDPFKYSEISVKDFNQLSGMDKSALYNTINPFSLRI